jgi:hypothetical protein
MPDEGRDTGAAMPTPLSPRILTRIARDFPEDERPGVAQLIGSIDLGPYAIGRIEPGRDRIHAAILKLADGDETRLRSACDLARRDWRDVLVAAEFANGDWPDRVDAFLGS